MPIFDRGDVVRVDANLAQSFDMIVDSVDNAIVIGTTVEGIGTLRVPLAACELVKRAKPNTVAVLDERAKREAAPIAPAPTTRKETSAKGAAPRRPRSSGPTKLHRAIELAAANPTLTRVELAALFVRELGMTTAGASTYSYAVLPKKVKS